MKKKILLFLTFILSAAPISAAAIDVNINNRKLALDVPASIINDRTMVPMRAIFENLGATVVWDEPTKGITAKKGSDIIQLTLNKKTAYINGTAKTLDAPPTARNGRTLVPARFVAEALGCTVKWNAKTETVDIFTSTATANRYKVIRVVDGDTFVIDYNGKEEKVRLIGIDTPESVHPDADRNSAAGITASDYTKSLLQGKSVELEFDVQERDKYGRLLAYAYVDGYMLNKKLLEDGYAVVSTYPPNVKYAEEFKAISRQESAFGEIDPAEASYIGNKNTKKFHKPSCSSVKDMAEHNRIGLESRNDAISAGFSPCGRCKP